MRKSNFGQSKDKISHPEMLVPIETRMTTTISSEGKNHGLKQSELSIKYSVRRRKESI